MSQETKNARFKLTNARIMRINAREKVAFLSVLCRAGKYPSYFDVTVFDAHLGRYGEGEAVTISGELQMRKPREPDGRWELQLIARRIEPGDEALAPVPRSEGRRNDNAEVERW